MPSLVPVKSHNKFKEENFQKTDTEGKSQDICQELTVTSGYSKVFFLRYMHYSWKHSNNRMVYLLRGMPWI